MPYTRTPVVITEEHEEILRDYSRIHNQLKHLLDPKYAIILRTLYNTGRGMRHREISIDSGVSMSSTNQRLGYLVSCSFVDSKHVGSNTYWFILDEAEPLVFSFAISQGANSTKVRQFQEALILEHGFLILKLLENEPLKFSDLHEIVYNDSSKTGLSKTLKKLHSSGLIERAGEKEKHVPLRLTDRGKEVVNAVDILWNASQSAKSIGLGVLSSGVKNDFEELIHPSVEKTKPDRRRTKRELAGPKVNREKPKKRDPIEVAVRTASILAQETITSRAVQEERTEQAAVKRLIQEEIKRKRAEERERLRRREHERKRSEKEKKSAENEHRKERIRLEKEAEKERKRLEKERRAFEATIKDRERVEKETEAERAEDGRVQAIIDSAILIKTPMCPRHGLLRFHEIKPLRVCSNCGKIYILKGDHVHRVVDATRARGEPVSE